MSRTMSRRPARPDRCITDRWNTISVLDVLHDGLESDWFRAGFVSRFNCLPLGETDQIACSLTKRILRPSGDHAGCAPVSARCFTAAPDAGPPPAVLMRMTLAVAVSAHRRVDVSRVDLSQITGLRNSSARAVSGHSVSQPGHGSSQVACILQPGKTEMRRECSDPRANAKREP